ncbi:MAG: adaptor protein MecA [Clostridia bacterium]|nr:adaptor protein MecA [Clostridia bacterium]MBQ5612602.1 adaptor protein MecA [Clostridia bacterium]MBQ5772015.1 adaptor protein MecA [Clostridia bacterium]
MELIRISDRKLKIMLTPTDMCHFELNAESLGEDGQRMHRAFRHLMEEVRKQTDFEGDDRQIAVQYFPSREGGCEMFISYSPLSEGAEGSCEQEKGGGKRSLLPHPVRQSTSFRRDCAYRFTALRDLLLVCRRLLLRGYDGESKAFFDEEGRYYLFVSILSPAPFSLPAEWDFLTEYGTVENASHLLIYIAEHGKPLCQAEAVQVLGALA